MICPACGRGLNELKVGGLVVDACEGGCGGVWFDNYELKKVDEQHEGAGAELLNVAHLEHLTVDHSKTRICPRCEGQKMVKRFQSTNKEIEIDECYACGGIWLDKGELGAIREQFETEKDKNCAAKDFFSANIEVELTKMSIESEEKAAKAKGFARLFRFICPSYYISGKQDGGAF
jgi:uncharacterized protein